MADENKVAGAPIGADSAPPEPQQQEQPLSQAAPVASPKVAAPPPPPAAPAGAVGASLTPQQPALPIQPAKAATVPKDGHLDEMRAELEAARKVREELQGMRDRTLAASRLAYLRRAGATAALTDENLMALAPVVDVQTEEGKAAIEEWRNQNAGLFASPQLSGKQTTASLVEGLKSSKNGVFGARLHARIAASALEE